MLRKATARYPTAHHECKGPTSARFQGSMHEVWRHGSPSRGAIIRMCLRQRWVRHAFYTEQLHSRLRYMQAVATRTMLRFIVQLGNVLLAYTNCEHISENEARVKTYSVVRTVGASTTAPHQQ